MSVEDVIRQAEATLGPGQLHESDHQLIRQANVRSFDELYEILNWFPGVASHNVQVAALSALAATHTSTAIRDEVAEHLATVPRTSFGALAAPNDPVKDDDVIGFDPIAALTPVPAAAPAIVPDPGVDVDKPDWPVRDQWRRGTCVAHAVIACCEHRLTNGGGPPDLSEQRLFYHCKLRDGSNTVDGTWISFARDAVLHDPVTTEDELRYNPEPTPNDYGQFAVPRDPAPPLAPLWAPPPAPTYGKPTAMFGNAATIRALLGNGRPVAIAVPVFADSADRRRTNWNGGRAFRTGEILDPAIGMVASGGHAVCVTRYVPDPSAKGGGWFVFRNSWGSDWAREAPSLAIPSPRGYGRLSADYVDRYLREYLQL